MMAMMATVICAQAIAQFKVTFQVNDSTGEGESFATIRLYNATDTSKVITTGVTTLEGAFSQNIAAPGSYKILISAVGKNTAQRTFNVSASQKEANLGTIVLGSAANVL